MLKILLRIRLPEYSIPTGEEPDQIQVKLVLKKLLRLLSPEAAGVAAGEEPV